ncbi:hypothetical protein MBLNU13_g04021t2 [Cladosporium sp. NU13]
MPAIYGSATLTIAALGANNGTGGCYLEPGLSVFVDVDTGPLRVRFFQKPPPYWHKLYGDDKYQHEGYGAQPLRTRSWTLQERFLSTRSIHYANGIMLWECKTSKGSSLLPWGDHDPPDDFVPWPVMESIRESSKADGPLVSRASWFRIIEDYTSRFMTKDMDKLPALSGVAANFSMSMQGDAYHAGLFRCQLPAALLWRSLESESNRSVHEASHSVRMYSAFQPRRPTQYRGPSWTWAALDCAISYDSQRLNNMGGQRPESGAPRRQGVIQVLDVQTQQSSSDRFGLVERSHLRVLGRITTVQIRWARWDHSVFGEGWRILTTTEGTAVGVVYPDIINELQFTKTLICLEVRDEPFWTESTIPHSVFGVPPGEKKEWKELDLVMGLALLPLPGHDGQFQRKGLVRWLKRDLFTDAEKSELTIV